MAAGDREPDLSAFQLEVAGLFFALPASQGFLLAGGVALLAQHLTERPAEDLDVFTAPKRGHVPAACDALEAAASQRGWYTQRIHDSDTFCRIVSELPVRIDALDLTIRSHQTYFAPGTIAPGTRGARITVMRLGPTSSGLNRPWPPSPVS